MKPCSTSTHAQPPAAKHGARPLLGELAVQLGAVGRRPLRVAAVIATALTLTAAGSALASGIGATRTRAAHTFTVFGFQEGALIVFPGTSPAALTQGDEVIVNDQLTSTRHGKGGYPIVGHDAGTCTLTRITSAHNALADCIATAALAGGSLTVQGIDDINAGVPQPSDLAVTGGTGKYAGARGTLHIKAAPGHVIYSFKLA